MSQALVTYTLPSGAQVLIQTFEKKDEAPPLVLYNGREIADTFISENDGSTLLPGIQVANNDLENVDATGILDSAVVANDLQCVFDVHTDVKCSTGGDLCKIVEIQGTLNSAVDISTTDGTLCNNEISSDNVYSVLCEDGIVLSSAGGIETLQCVVDKAVTIEENNVQSGSSQQFNNTLCGDEEHSVPLNSNANDIRIPESVNTEIILSGYPGIPDHSSGSLCQLINTTTSSSDSILEQACHSVELTSEGITDLKTDAKVGSLSSRSVFENLDEFAEMVMWFKCRLCKFGAGSKDELLTHISTQHLEANVTLETTKNDRGISRDDNIHSAANGSGESKREMPALVQAAKSEKLVYLCGQCSFGFHSLEACKQHMVKDHQLAVQINMKEHTFDNLKSSSTKEVKEEAKVVAPMEEVPLPLASETEKHHNSQKCPFRGCQSKFSSEESLQVHTSCHSTNDNYREFRCCECRSQFERWRTCAMHLWKEHNIDCGLLTCPVCLTYKTVTSVSLENHQRIHREDRAFMCPECGKGFKQAAQLHNHRVMHMDRKTSDLPRWYASKRCDICFKNYANSKCLKKHIQAVHSKLRPYVCQVCGHASARKAMLQLHYRQHTGEKPHSCPVCDYRTGDHNSLRRHVMRHTGQRPYRCPHCSYTAIQSNSYKNHLRNKHPGASGVYSCSQCNFKTVSHAGYLLHISDHKNGVISNSSDGNGSDVEVFPGNVAAAQLIYRCLSALSADGISVEASVTGSSTSADGTTQTITIQIPTQEAKADSEEDEEEEEGTGDTGGITIPADPC